MRSGGWLRISVPQKWSFSSAATMCRADVWSPWLLLRRFGKHRQLLSVAVSKPDGQVRASAIASLQSLTITDDN